MGVAIARYVYRTQCSVTLAVALSLLLPFGVGLVASVLEIATPFTLTVFVISAILLAMLAIPVVLALSYPLQGKARCEYKKYFATRRRTDD